MPSARAAAQGLSLVSLDVSSPFFNTSTLTPPRLTTNPQVDFDPTLKKKKKKKKVVLDVDSDGEAVEAVTGEMDDLGVVSEDFGKKKKKTKDGDGDAGDDDDKEEEEKEEEERRQKETLKGEENDVKPPDFDECWMLSCHPQFGQLLAECRADGSDFTRSSSSNGHHSLREKSKSTLISTSAQDHVPQVFTASDFDDSDI